MNNPSLTVIVLFTLSTATISEAQVEREPRTSLLRFEKPEFQLYADRFEFTEYEEATPASADVPANVRPIVTPEETPSLTPLMRYQNLSRRLREREVRFFEGLERRLKEIDHWATPPSEDRAVQKGPAVERTTPTHEAVPSERVYFEEDPIGDPAWYLERQRVNKTAPETPWNKPAAWLFKHSQTNEFELLAENTQVEERKWA